MKPNKNQIRLVVLTLFIFVLAIFGISKFINPISTVVAQTNATPQPSTPTESEKLLAELTKSIAGKENQNAGEVWKNVQQFKELPANRFLRLMNTYTKVLGVSCSHCHIVGQWEKEDLQTKQIAREMMDMMDRINTQELAKVKNLKGKPPLISCYTCHRGQPTPATRLPAISPQNPPTVEKKQTILFLGVFHFEDDRIDITSPKWQKEITALVENLKEFKPTKIAVEALPTDTKLNENYSQFLKNNHQLANDEINQIGFRLAKELKHERLYPIDWRNKFDLNPVLAYATANNQGAIVQKGLADFSVTERKLGELIKNSSLNEIFQYLNDDKNLRLVDDAMLKTLVQIGKDDNYIGTDVVADWYERNLKIFSNLKRITEKDDERVLVIIGGGHVNLLRRFSEEFGFTIEKTDRFLK